MTDDSITRREYEEHCKRIDDEQNRQNHRLTSLENGQKVLSELTISIKVLAVNMEGMAKEQTEQGERLKAIEDIPGKRWGDVVKTVITVLVSAVVGFGLSKVGL
ncbi:hypothetical protein SAMN02745687_00910 [Lachnospiraceae bacterium NK3A20]|nr:hypothetical protein SAMN02745687_00910 [Lachnospiraceae bacterium NK3A20]